MKATVIQQFVVTAMTVGLATLAALPASAQQTTADAMASIKYLAGTWHCTGGGPAEDDTYTLVKGMTPPRMAGVTSGTFDAKRQKWIVFVMGADGSYAVNEGTLPASNPNQLVLTIPYPVGSNKTYNFTKLSDTQFTLGPQSCTKK